MWEVWFCEDNQCVGCPSPKRLLIWSKSRVPKKLSSCLLARQTAFHYYKVEGVDHFSKDTEDMV
ncbi:hypothetical protein GBA52_018056 [Prunus armeniaca]|nr:hypothetical protein GBA52_018056 [Prunus armeniaca]